MLLLKGKVEEIEDKIADLKALLSLIEAWEKGGEMKNNSEHKLQYKVHTQTGSLVITITLTGATDEQMVEKFIQTLDAEVTKALKRKVGLKFEKIGGEK